MKTLFALSLLIVTLVLTSCTAVVEPAPATTSTTVHRESSVTTAPARTSTTTTRVSGGY